MRVGRIVERSVGSRHSTGCGAGGREEERERLASPTPAEAAPAAAVSAAVGVGALPCALVGAAEEAAALAGPWVGGGDGLDCL